MLLNVRSIKSNFGRRKSNVETLIDSYDDLPFVFLTETWLISADSNILFPNANLFNVFRCDRVSERRGGGVAILVPKKYSTVQCCKHSSPEFEAIWCKVISGKREIKFGLIYRPPHNHASMPELLLDHIEQNFDHTVPTVVMGDFNFGKINWELLVSPDKSSEKFMNYINSLGFEQKVTFSTRESAILDLVFTNEPNFVQCVEEAPQIDGCDHKTVKGFFMLEEVTAEFVSFRQYRKADYNPIIHQLVNVNWAELFGHCNSVQEKWENFLSLLSSVIDFFIPLRKVANSKKKFQSNRVRNLCRKAYNLHKKYKAENSHENHEKYLEASRVAQREKRTAVFENERKIMTSGNQTKFWNHIKSKLTYKSSIPCILSDLGEPIISNTGKANRLNDFFASVFTADDGKFPFWDIAQPESLLSEVDFAPHIVHEKLRNLPNKLSSGPDTLPSFLLRKLAFALGEPLANIFSASFESGILPHDWLSANVVPIYKNKGNESSAENYRPVSLTCVCCKVMESIIYDSLLAHVRHRITPDQHGFLSGRSTVTQLLETLNDWTLATDSGQVIDVLYIDICKAFDSLPHSKLLSKLEKYGISGKLLSWIRAFLTGRTQKVVIDGHESDYVPVTSGVPQGSVLGPLLFLLYMNDLPQVLQNASIKMFADDCKFYVIFRRNREARDLLQADIDQLMQWAGTNQLRIAFSKCGILHFGVKNPNYHYFFGTEEIPCVDSIRDLGVIISSDMKFEKHMNNITKLASRTANLIHRCFIYKKPEFLMQMFNVFVRSKLEYASPVWNPQYKKDIDVIEKVQRRFTRRIRGCKNLSYVERLKKLDAFPLELRRLHLDLTLTFKFLKNKMNVSYVKLFKLKNSTCRGHELQLYPPRFATNIRKNFFSSRIVNIWNALPRKLVNTNSVACFKKLLLSKEVTDLLWPFLKGGGLDQS